MITPLRSAMAAQDSHCEMDDMSASDRSVSTMQNLTSSVSPHQIHFYMAIVDMVQPDPDTVGWLLVVMITLVQVIVTWASVFQY